MLSFRGLVNILEIYVDQASPMNAKNVQITSSSYSTI